MAFSLNAHPSQRDCLRAVLHDVREFDVGNSVVVNPSADEFACTFAPCQVTQSGHDCVGKVVPRQVVGFDFKALGRSAHSVTTTSVLFEVVLHAEPVPSLDGEV